MTNFTRKTGYTFSLGCLYSAIAMSSMATYGSTVTVEATITASGTETALAAQPYSAPLTGIARFDTGCNLFCGGPVTKSTNETHPVPSQYSHCPIDTSRGNKLPGLSVYVSSANSPGGAMSENYTLDIAARTMRAQVSVSALRQMGAWYTASYEIHVKCPQTVPWTNTQTQTITIDSKNGYANVGSYTGPIGTINAIGNSAVANNNLYKVELKNPVPANAVITADMFLTSPPDTAKGPYLFALYEPDNLPATGVRFLPSATDSNEGGGMSVGDINNNGIEDIIFATYQDAGGPNEYKYQIGWDIDTEGNPKVWSPFKRVDGTGWEGRGASVALFKPTITGAATRAIFVNYDTLPDLRIKYGTIDLNGDFSQSGYLTTTSFGALAYGVGVELYDINGNGAPEIILSGNSSYHKYKIGWDLQDSGAVSKWTEHQGNSYSSTAVAVALGNLDRNPRPEIVMAYRNPADNRVYRAVGWNLDQDGVARQWEAARPIAMSLPATAHRIDIALMDLDVFGQTSQRGSGHREKTIVIAGLDSSSTPDNFHYSFLRHSNARDGVFNGNMTSTAKWHRWGTPLPALDGPRTALCGSNVGTTNPWDAGIYSQEPISIEAGKRYAVTFDAEVATTATVGAKLGSATVNTAIYGQNLAIALKPGWNRYQMAFTPNAKDANARLEFFFGGTTAASKVCIDNVRFAPVLNTANDFASFPGNSSTALIKNGNFNFVSMAGWEIKSEAAGATQAATKIKNGELCHYTPGASNLVKESLGQNNIALEAGATYKLAFDIRGNYLPISKVNPTVELKIGADGPAFDQYMLESAVEVLKEKTTKTFEFKMDQADTAAGFAIFTGNTYASEICIDNVSLTKK
ncbi:MAG: cel1 [Cellvibrio sp.]|jgi:hypothetical protein|nr:cel1 [Cellvibrio sp.]